MISPSKQLTEEVFFKRTLDLTLSLQELWQSGLFMAARRSSALAFSILFWLFVSKNLFADAQISPVTDEARTRPNVILILADDLGWRDTGFAGSSFYQTPHLDSLASSGLRFTQAYAASPLCSPTRASILTGRTPGRLRFTAPAGHLPEVVLDPTVPDAASPSMRATIPESCSRLDFKYLTLGQSLKRAGYATGFMGKWHLGSAPYLPENFGFDEVVGGRGTPGPPNGSYFGPWPDANLPEVPAGTHISDVLGDEAVRFVEKHRAEPFFLCLWFYDVHAPFQAKPDLVEKYRQRIDPSDSQRNPTMAAMIDVMDQNVGKVMAALKRLELTDDTIIIFTSDNGGNEYDVIAGEHPTNNDPLRGGKGSNYEGGVRVPLLVRWPGRITAGLDETTQVSTVDLFPTVLQLCGLPQQPDDHLDGVSIAPALAGEPMADHPPIFSHFPHEIGATQNFPNTTVRLGDWKLYRFYFDTTNQQDRYELYNLANDIGEHHNLATENPEKTAELAGLLEHYLEKSGALLPKRNPHYAGNMRAGWQALGDTQLSSKDGMLLASSEGHDPRVSTRVVPPLTNDRASLRFELMTERPGHAAIFWSTTKEDGFKRDRRTTIPVIGGPVWQTIEAHIRVDGTLTGLRIDPTDQAAARSKIRKIELLSSTGANLMEWTFPESE